MLKFFLGIKRLKISKENRYILRRWIKLPCYKRTTNIDAVQFFEKEYRKNKEKYLEVKDRATFSELWANKTASDGRYYIPTEKNTFFSTEYVIVYEGDYLMQEESGNIYTLPSAVFEKNFKLATK